MRVTQEKFGCVVIWCSLLDTSCVVEDDSKATPTRLRKFWLSFFSSEVQYMLVIFPLIS